MSLNIKNPEVVRLAEEVSRLQGVSKTEAIRVALDEKRARLALPDLDAEWARFDEETAALRANLGEEAFRPVTKAEYDALFED